MPTSENIKRAVELVDGMVQLADAECRELKRQIVNAAQGNEHALACVVFFPRDHRVFGRRNLAILREIILLVMREPAERMEPEGE